MKNPWNVLLVLLGAFFAGSFVNSFFSYQLLGYSLVSVGYYFVVPAAGAAVCFGALLLPPARRALVAVNLLAALVAVGLGSLLIARFLRVASSPEGVAPETGGRIQRVLDLRDRGEDAYPAFSPVNVLAHPRRLTEDGDLALRDEFRISGEPVIPLTSLPNRLTVLCRETEEFVAYRTDETGFANPPGMWNAPPEVVVIGDSYVHGHCVPAAQALVGRLREDVPRAVNLGVEGTGPLAQLAILREYAAALRPETVVWVYFENDLYDLEVERRVPIYRRYLKPGFSQHLLDRRADVEAMLERYLDANLAQRRAGESAGTEELGLSRRIHRVIHPAGVRTAVARIHTHAVADIPRFRAVLTRAREDAGSWGGRLVFVYLPSWTYFTRSIGPADHYRRRNRRDVLETARDLGIPVVDVLPVFQADADPARFFLGHNLHYTPAGYAVAARAIAEGIRDRR